MPDVSTRRVPVIARGDRTRLAFLTSTHVVDDLYQGAVPALLPFLAIAVFPALASALRFLLCDLR
jgi:hypothetical protein